MNLPGSYFVKFCAVIFYGVELLKIQSNEGLPQLKGLHVGLSASATRENGVGGSAPHSPTLFLFLIDLTSKIDKNGA